MDEWDRLKIAGHAKLDPRTVLRAYEGGKVTAANWVAIAVAAKALDMRAPPTPKKRHVPGGSRW